MQYVYVLVLIGSEVDSLFSIALPLVARPRSFRISSNMLFKSPVTSTRLVPVLPEPATLLVVDCFMTISVVVEGMVDNVDASIVRITASLSLRRIWIDGISQGEIFGTQIGECQIRPTGTYLAERGLGTWLVTRRIGLEFGRERRGRCTCAQAVANAVVAHEDITT